MDIGKIAVYLLVFWLGGGLYASLMTIPFRVRGTVSQSTFNALILTWVPVFGVIAFLWRPF